MLQDQLRQAQESVSTMRKLHEFAQSQLFELRAQSGQNAFQICVFIFTIITSTYKLAVRAYAS